VLLGNSYEEITNMADDALNEGIAWKKGKVQRELDDAVAKFLEHAADPAAVSQLPNDLALVNRKLDELDTLNGPNRGKAWDLVMENLDDSIGIAEDELERWMAMVAVAPRTLPYRGESERLRRNLENLKGLRDRLNAEGRPPG
jgi:hypothetical protein